jgi:hypothetical protein
MLHRFEPLAIFLGIFTAIFKIWLHSKRFCVCVWRTCLRDLLVCERLALVSVGFVSVGV